MNLFISTPDGFRISNVRGWNPEFADVSDDGTAAKIDEFDQSGYPKDAWNVGSYLGGRRAYEEWKRG